MPISGPLKLSSTGELNISLGPSQKKAGYASLISVSGDAQKAGKLVAF